jgi:hypothetical protein
MFTTFQDLGIPPQYGFERLLYSPSAGTVVAQARWADRGFRPRLLFVRDVNEEHYTPVGMHEEMLDQGSPQVSLAKPWLAFITARFQIGKDASGEERIGGNPEDVKVFDLSLRSDVLTIPMGNLVLPSDMTDGWISSLLSFSESADALYAVAALSRNRRTTMEYYLSRLELTSSRVEIIALLRTPFF